MSQLEVFFYIACLLAFVAGGLTAVAFVGLTLADSRSRYLRVLSGPSVLVLGTLLIVALLNLPRG